MRLHIGEFGMALSSSVLMLACGSAAPGRINATSTAALSSCKVVNYSLSDTDPDYMFAITVCEDTSSSTYYTVCELWNTTSNPAHEVMTQMNFCRLWQEGGGLLTEASPAPNLAMLANPDRDLNGAYHQWATPAVPIHPSPDVPFVAGSFNFRWNMQWDSTTHTWTGGTTVGQMQNYN
jgi:hypothetical protein